MHQKRRIEMSNSIYKVPANFCMNPSLAMLVNSQRVKCNHFACKSPEDICIQYSLTMRQASAEACRESDT